jgi:hypothetical protein
MTASIPPPPAATADRLVGLDAARLVATLGVVWFHSIECDQLHASGVLGRFSVAFYTLAAMIFLVQSAERRRRPYASYILERLRRLGIPFVGWGLITVGIMYLVARGGYPLDLPQLSWDRLADGGTLHLYFLPFLFLASIGVYPFALFMRGNRARQWTVAALCVAIALALDCGLFNSIRPPHGPFIGRFFEVTVDRWSSVYWGVAAAVVWSRGLSRSRWRIVFAVAGAMLLVVTTAWQWKYGLVSQFKVYGGLGLLAVALAPWHNAFLRFLAPFGRMSAGVYFAHMAAIYVVRYFWMRSHLQAGPTRDTAVFVCASLLCFVIIALLAALPGCRALAGYDSSRRPAADPPTPSFLPQRS